MTSAHRLARLLLLSAVAAGCLSRADAAPDDLQPSNAEIRTALESVYYHAYLVRDRREPTLAERPMPLARAAKILDSDHSFGASSRRRRAIGKLGAAYRLLTTPGVPPGPLSEADPLDALKLLGAPPSVIVRGTPGHESFADLERGVYAALNKAPSPGYEPQCCSCVLSCDVFDGGKTVKTAFTIRVGRVVDGAAGLKFVTDPQNWDACNPLYFIDTHYAGKDCPAAQSSTPTTLAPTPGTNWDGVLYEHFSHSPVYFTNLLDICAGASSPPGRRFNYGLCKAEGGTHKLKEDCGFATAMKDPATTGPFKSRLQGLKILHFETLSPGMIAMEVMVDETAQVAVCCGLKEPKCPCNTPTCFLAGSQGSVQNETCPTCP
jgi:hypothetical protein